jgi:hypothetical protein
LPYFGNISKKIVNKDVQIFHDLGMLGGVSKSADINNNVFDKDGSQQETEKADKELEENVLPLSRTAFLWPLRMEHEQQQMCFVCCY